MTYNHIEVKPVAGFIGAEIGNVDLSRPLHDDAVKEIRQALLKWKVVFFRNQNIDHAAQIAFTARFGEVTYAHPHEDEPIEGFSEILPIDRSRYERRNGLRRSSYESRWHTDVTAVVNPPAGSILRAVNVPSVGGDTQWTNLVAAYEGLSAPLRALADTLKAEHRFNARLNLPKNSKLVQRIEANPLVSIHPVVRVHPETGERALFVNPGFTSHILDVSRQESDLLLELFFNQITKPAYTTRFRWNNGDIAFWDNRATAHLAPQDLDHIEVERVLYRTTIKGDVPVGVDGFRSQIVEGEAFGTEAPSILRNNTQRVQAEPVLS
ncbi:TauD/TfdA family dioxygenase [Aetokthonos hydrillicola Thurmond2011]|jgi:taurine dioxygenase|uniref:TauD/TfdA family dioxygenase n=1 Tax=Aetokthonos hydrillicola Thurmond2011 TaxID=2712845 RepID=A0AAP5I0K5_9CYAN|nr:TauD/TfdA family dioxygenase [Aetokthonos hydrillicola]MBO3460132.1 TauD/TfdA family dioxygenase [Aetokthonos hydrillicola CCALA 1050]MBW4590458.1 TauD/TfdA family dioxygenase [Aetokthonos hydrillicola CCALA 1050]MDR9892988.1 TauD/TfdA family dioxygenase [Aetokthonos hydrillicola Thurmond2011]